MILTAFIVNLIERIINVSIFNVFNRSSFGNGVFAEDYQKMTISFLRPGPSDSDDRNDLNRRALSVPALISSDFADIIGVTLRMS